MSFNLVFCYRTDKKKSLIQSDIVISYRLKGTFPVANKNFLAYIPNKTNYIRLKFK